MRIERLSLAYLPALLLPGTAFAHSPIEGIGSFYNGMLHPVLVPAHLLLLIAVGLFLGQQGSKKVERPLGVFGVSTILGLFMAWFSIGSGLETIVLTLAATVGLLVAISPQMPSSGRTLIALLAGFSLGIDSAQEELFGKDRFVSLFGSGVAIYFLVFYPLAIADYLNKKSWQKIGIRIVGSWVAASSLLVLTLSFSTRL